MQDTSTHSVMKLNKIGLLNQFKYLRKINGKYFATTDMNSAYNQMPLDEQSRRLTQFVIGNQQYELNRLFYGISIGPAAFSAFMSKIFRPRILDKTAITYLDDVFCIKKRRNVH